MHDVRFACQDLAVSLLGASLGVRNLGVIRT